MRVTNPHITLRSMGKSLPSDASIPNWGETFCQYSTPFNFPANCLSVPAANMHECYDFSLDGLDTVARPVGVSLTTCTKIHGSLFTG